MPATVVMVPEVSTLRMTWLKKSAMKRFPAPSTSRSMGLSSLAAVAGPPSPEYPNLPVPATVVMTPEVSTLRILWLSRSAMKRLPEESTATPEGRESSADVAAPPSPEYPARPVPATVEMSPAAAAAGSGGKVTTKLAARIVSAARTRRT